MTDPEVLQKLASLTERQREVLGMVCDGYDYKTIAEKLVVAVPTIKAHVGNIYVKLDLDQMIVALRKKALFEIYCPALREADFAPRKEEEIEPEPVPEYVQEMVEEDEKAMIPYVKGEIIHIPSDEPIKPRRSRVWLLIIIMLILLALSVLGGFEVYERVTDFLGDLGVIAVEPSPDPTQEMIAISSPTVQIAQAQPTAIPMETMVIPTKTIMLPTQTQPPPTSTSTLSPTSPPKPITLFDDNFDQGLSPTWQGISGNPSIVNGMLTADQETWLFVGDPSWTNYSVEFEADAGDCMLSWGSNVVAVRVSDMDNMFAYKWADCESFCYVVENGTWNEVPHSEFKPGFEMLRFRVNVEGDLITIYVDGQKQTSFFNDKYQQGKVGLMIAKDTLIDNFRVKQIED